MNRLIITANSSNGGKTTVTCAIIAALKRRGLDVGAFKCGPDYIDPMFHRAMGAASYNLDPYFMGADGLRAHFAAHAREINIIEGVMGFYDGIAGTKEGSTATVAEILQAPVIFAEGLLEPDERLRIPSRHLGLAAEFACNEELFNRFANAGERLDIENLLKLAASAPEIKAGKPGVKHIGSVRIAVARDAAFCFMYEENLELLSSLGAVILPFSPLNDTALPENTDGLYLCGGYPELYEDALMANKSMCNSIRGAVESGLPAIAECGGFIYLHYAGAIKGKISKRDKLQRFGYIEITAKYANLLCKAGESIRSHEFHYYDSDNPGSGFTAAKPIRGDTWDCIQATGALYAGFPHLYLPANPSFAENFVQKCFIAVKNK